MKTTLLISLFLFFWTNSFAQQCKPKDCVVPIKDGCKQYCKERVLKVADEKELKQIGLSDSTIKVIFKYRIDSSKKVEDILSKEEQAKIFKTKIKE